MFDKKDQGFDARTCITAGALRQSGFTVPEVIPDCAWVPRSAIIFHARADKEARISADGRIEMSIHLNLDQPFRWIAVRVESSR